MAARRPRKHMGAKPVGCRLFVALLVAVCLTTISVAAQDPAPQLVVGRNSNMLGGEQILTLNPFEVRGDVLGRADNEPSCTFSTRNPNHVICGANTYRMVDVPGVSATSETRDAWQGVYQSNNGGDTWESTLHPGFFLDPRLHQFKLLQFRAAADPTLRSGPAGLAFYSGIAFKQDKSVNSLFVSTFADLNNRENDPMPFKFVRTIVVDLKTAPKFIDKPWMWVEAAPPGQMCTMIVRTDEDGGTPLWASTWWGKLVSRWLSNRWPSWRPRDVVAQQVPASIVHVMYSIFQDTNESKADLMYTKSTNCGSTFSTPKKLNIVQEPANGAAIAKPLVSGSQRIFGAWRRVKVDPTGPSNAILSVVSNNNGSTWTAPKVVAEVCAFEQATTGNSFRTTAFPTMTADASGRAYLAWSDRGRRSDGTCDPFGAGRIMLSTSIDGVTWSLPQVAVPSSTPEHQIMPSLAFTAGKLFLAWVDFKEDVSGVFGQHITEANLFDQNGQPVNPPARRHTADVRAAMADPATADFAGQVAEVSRYLMGRTPSIAPNVPGQPVQLQWNAWNRRWARRGTVPFDGDYIDIATMPYLPPDPSANPPRPNWTPNNGQVPTTPMVLIAWTDNRDMRDLAPSQLNKDGSVPFTVPANKPGVLQLGSGTTSIVDPTQTRQVCSADGVYKTGTTNQNIYAARALVGFTANSPSGNKTLGAVPRSFVVYVRNDTDLSKTFRLQIPSQPAGGIASFDQFTAGVTVVEPIIVARRSSIARTVFVSKDATPTLLDPRATIRVDVVELANGSVAAVDAVYLNADRSAPEIDSPEIDSREIFLPEIDSPEIDSVEPGSPEIDSPEIDSPEIDSETLKALGLQAPEIDSPEIDSPEIDSPEIDSPEIDSPEIDSAPLQDVKFRVTNQGNTTGQYNAKTLVRGANAGLYNYQIIVRRKYDLRAVDPNCQPTTVPVSKVLVNVLDTNPQSPEIDSPEIDSNAPGAASFFLMPGETGEVIVRTRKLTSAAPDLTIDNIGLAAQPEAVGTDDAAAGITEPPVTTSFLSVATRGVPNGVTGTPYNTQLDASGDAPPFTWTIALGTLPPGLTLSTAGVISGTPTTAGTYPFTVQVSDGRGDTATAAFTITITQAGAASLAFVTQPSATIFGQQITPSVSVRAVNANGSFAAGTMVTIAIGTNPAGGTLSGTLTAVTGSTGVATFTGLSINRVGAGYTLVASAFGFPIATSVAFDITSSVSSGVAVFDNQIDFLVATGAANATGPLPSLGSVNGGATVGGVTFNLAPGGDTLDIGGATDWYPGLAGNEIALGFENLQVSFASPVTAMGFRFVEPDATMPPHGGTPTDSTFHVTLFNGTAAVGSFSFNAPDDQLAFVGVASGTPFTHAQIIDTSASDDDEYFGEFYTSTGTSAAYVVTNIADSGPGSLRQAIADANTTPSADSVVFNIPGGGLQTITPFTPLPAALASGGPINIDGTTQPGFASLGTPQIQLGGSFAPTGGGLSLFAGQSRVRGLIINGFGVDGIALNNAGANIVLGNWIGLASDGLTPDGNGEAGVRLVSSGANVIGGQTPLARNVIAANLGWGVRIEGATSTNNLIVGNYIGLSAAGNFAVGNAAGGVFVGAANNTIGGPTSIPGTELGNVISGQMATTAGIAVGGPGASGILGTVIQGNIIGLDATGTIDLSGGDGVRTFNSSVRVGGTTTGVRNIISGNVNGISFSNSGSTFNSFIEGNFIGTDITGTLDRGNNAGISIASAPGVRVGSDAPGAGNLISGNVTGVSISAISHPVIPLLGALHNAVVQGNLIGVNVTGTAALGNVNGIGISNTHNLIGGTPAGARNIIAGNTGDGVAISGGAAPSPAANNLIQGNFIGTDISGTLDLGNGGNGVGILQSPNNTVGGTTAGARNIISGNGVDGVSIGASISQGNIVQGNYIGTDVTGTMAIGNVSRGITTSGTNTVIGGTDPGARNILSGNQIGIRLGAASLGFPNATVQGNYIGVDVTGTVAIPNQFGIFVNGSDDNLIGGTTSAARNVISGNSNRGISLHNLPASGNQISGNFVGTNAAGTVAIPNLAGIIIESDSSNNVVGGSVAGAGNVVSGNASTAITIVGSGTNANVVAGNFIGTDATGAGALPNQGNGVQIVDAPNNVVGGTVTGAANVISSNVGEGVRIDGATATGNVVQGNLIGSNVTQTVALGNSASGIYIRRAPGNSVLGNNVQHNLGFAGVALCGNLGGFCGGFDIGTQTSNGDGNSVQGNVLNNNIGRGLSLDGVANTLVGTTSTNNISSNGVNGVMIFGNGATGNQISSNAINGNVGDGVHIVGASNTGNRLQNNSFINNLDLAIDLGGNGVTSNDAADADTGPNNFQNFPVLTTVTTTSVEGTLHSTPNTAFSVQLYESIAACGASGQGETLIATFAVNTAGNGDGSFLEGGFTLTSGRYAMATATDPAGNTSEFSACVLVP
jgi:hypothetical protein